jgi:hypothetical protein
MSESVIAQKRSRGKIDPNRRGLLQELLTESDVVVTLTKRTCLKLQDSLVNLENGILKNALGLA